jgi:hypothetical protein
MFTCMCDMPVHACIVGQADGEVGVDSSDYHAIDVDLTWIIVDYHIIQDC